MLWETCAFLELYSVLKIEYMDILQYKLFWLKCKNLQIICLFYRYRACKKHKTGWHYRFYIFFSLPDCRCLTVHSSSLFSGADMLQTRHSYHWSRHVLPILAGLRRKTQTHAAKIASKHWWHSLNGARIACIILSVQKNPATNVIAVSSYCCVQCWSEHVRSLDLEHLTFFSST